MEGEQRPKHNWNISPFIGQWMVLGQVSPCLLRCSCCGALFSLPVAFRFPRQWKLLQKYNSCKSSAYAHVCYAPSSHTRLTAILVEFQFMQCSRNCFVSAIVNEFIWPNSGFEPSSIQLWYVTRPILPHWLSYHYSSGEIT